MILQKSLGILLEEKFTGISEVQRVKNYDGESERMKGESLEACNGGEYTSIEFKAYLAGEGIRLQISISG